MSYSSDKMGKEYYPKRKVRFEDIVFWILIFATIAVILWKLFGSPSDIATIITIGIFIISSEALIWKYVFNLDKKTAVEFMKVKNIFTTVKHDIEKIKIEMNNRFDKMDNRFDIIDNKLDKLIR